ncbi:hypothetical protein QJS10_CPA16g01206 [Acorus calamus]|uniref:Uncharacterized protein n=1 Tax=Acorus calamus TaxID=4465 RepID=A0AAV9D3M7_ACOCL|nr:hypothetical protein QJS10_CPA16g01206 [Acorus calamus]
MVVITFSTEPTTPFKKSKEGLRRLSSFHPTSQEKLHLGLQDLVGIGREQPRALGDNAGKMGPTKAIVLEESDYGIGLLCRFDVNTYLRADSGDNPHEFMRYETVVGDGSPFFDRFARWVMDLGDEFPRNREWLPFKMDFADVNDGGGGGGGEYVKGLFWETFLQRSFNIA